MTSWIDTHSHLDADEFAADADAMRTRARNAGVTHCVIPAVEPANFDRVRLLAHRFGDSYALGIHPIFVGGVADDALEQLDRALALHRADLRLVAVGEIGLDLFLPQLKTGALLERQEYFYREQLKLARKHELPVILHVRRSADRLLKYLRELAPEGGWRGIAHAFNGSEQQAEAFIRLGFKLGFGGALTFDSALQLRLLARTLPLDALVLETDSPDIPPHWLYTPAQHRAQGTPQGRNEPAQLPRIARELASIREMTPEALAAATRANALSALPRLEGLLAGSSPEKQL